MKLSPLLLSISQVALIQAKAPLNARQLTSTATSQTITLPVSSTSSSPTPTGPRNHNVAVGQNSTQFTPTTLKSIPIGDTLTFYFYPANYTIVQSTFARPCHPIPHTDTSHALFPGFHRAPANTIAPTKFFVRITDASPIWIYAVDGTDLANGDGMAKCKAGMSMVVNPIPKDQGGDTLTRYRKNAMEAAANEPSKEVVPETIGGGEVRAVTDKERARWMSKHPIGGNKKVEEMRNGTADDQGDYGVQQYTSGAGQNAGFALLIVSMLGLLW